MKRIITVIMILGLSASFANADWLGDFMDNYTNKNIDEAVEKAVEEGITPDDIVKNGLTIETLSPPDLVKALYCAGVTGEDIYNAAQKNSVSEVIVTEGFRKSKDECGDMVTDTQPYTPIGQQPSGFRGANRDSDSNVASDTTPQ